MAHVLSAQPAMCDSAWCQLTGKAQILRGVCVQEVTLVLLNLSGWAF